LDDRPFDIDTTVETSSGEKGVEEKIVHWPLIKGTKTPRADPYTAFALETMSCTTEGREREGWMRSSQADILIYCFSVPDTEVGLNCYVMDMQTLKQWFWNADQSMWPVTRTDQINRTECLVVPVSDVVASGIKIKRYLIGPGWPDSHFCETCLNEAGFGFDYDTLHGKRGKWFCMEHKP
jgi:hypothetical protein